MVIISYLEQKLVGLCVAELALNYLNSCVKGLTDRVSRTENLGVESLWEKDCCLVLDCVFLFNADHMLHSCIKEDLSTALGMTRGNNYKPEV